MSLKEQQLSADADSLRGIIRQLEIDYARVQRKWEKSERVNAKLLSALEGLVKWLETRPAGIHIEVVPEITDAREAIEEARK